MAMNTPSRLHLFGLAGSLRCGSHSRAVLRGIRAHLASDVVLTIHDPRLPLYDADEDGETVSHRR